MEEGPADIECFVNKNLDISQQVYAHLDKKGWTQKDLAEKLDKSEAEVSKWLNGMHNLTLRSIAKIEAVLGEDVILTPLKAEERYKKSEFVKLHVYAKSNNGILQSDADFAYSGTSSFGKKAGKTKEKAAA